MDTATQLFFTLSVSDGINEPVTITYEIWLAPAGYMPPEADAGPDQTAWEGEIVYLDGVNSTLDFSLTYQWTQISGPVDVELSADSFLGYFTVPTISESIGTFVFQLTISDESGYTVSDTATITVKKDLPPTAPTSSLTPTDANGVWESDELTPILTVSNAEDANGGALIYEFELYDAEIAIDENLVADAEAVPEGENITTWQTIRLEENTAYWWRARAIEAENASNSGPWMALAPIFVNTVEENPGVPTVGSPAHGNDVSTTTPVLAVTNAKDPDLDPLSYEFRIYLDPGDQIYSPHLEKSGVLEETGGTTRWKVESALVENETYWWRVRAVDDTGLAGGWTELAVFTVNAANEAPGVPTVAYPMDESEIDTPDPVFEIEAGSDPEGDPVVIYVELDRVNTFNSGDRTQSDALEVVEATTMWAVTERLEENSTYYYRVKSSDGQTESGWSDTASFFVNQTNEPPYPLMNQYPAPENGGEIVTTLNPLLKAVATTEKADPDNDSVTYEFEIYLTENLTDPVAGTDGLETGEWEVTEISLSNGKKYQWHARAVDEHGEPGTWSELTPFTVGANNFRPHAPVLVSPFKNGTVNTLTPTLIVVAMDDGDNSTIWIEFELYGGSGIGDASNLLSVTVVKMGDTTTSWTVNDVILENQQTCCWRARAWDGELYSEWTPVNLFTVDEKGEISSRVDVLQATYYDPTAPWETVVTVDNDRSAIDGAQVILTPGALSTPETIYIGVAKDVPNMDATLLPLGKVIDFGPAGIKFNVSVTIKIPYSDDDLMLAGGIEPEELRVYTHTHSEAACRWEEIQILAVDSEEKVLICEVEHFSLYSTAADSGKAGETDPVSEGGGGGGCFIGAAESSFPTGDVVRTVFAILTMSLVILNDRRK